MFAIAVAAVVVFQSVHIGLEKAYLSTVSDMPSFHFISFDSICICLNAQIEILHQFIVVINSFIIFIVFDIFKSFSCVMHLFKSVKLNNKTIEKKGTHTHKRIQSECS